MEHQWRKVNKYTPEWVKERKYPEWRLAQIDKYHPFTVYFIDGQSIQVLESLNQIKKMLNGPEPF